MHIQIIAMGVTNRRDQQKEQFIAFVHGPSWTVLTHIRVFPFDF